MVALLPSVTLTEQQRVLTLTDTDERLRLANDTLAEYMNKMEVEKAIKERVDEDMSSKQKDFYLRQQLKAIQKELGEEESDEDDLAQLTRNLEEADLPPQVAQVGRALSLLPTSRAMHPLDTHDSSSTRSLCSPGALAGWPAAADVTTVRWSCGTSSASRR